MKTDKSLPLDCLESMAFHPCPVPEFLNPMGSCFAPDPSLGEGYYWFYEQPGLFAIAQMELRAREDYIMEYLQPDFISINYYDTISAEELSPYKRLSAHCIRGHVSEGELFRMRCHKNMPLRGIELVLMPGYYEDYLRERYPGEFPDPKEAFRSIDGCRDFPELVLVLKQMIGFRGAGPAADLYYGSKVAEALSLVIEHSRGRSGEKEEKSLYKQDYVNLNAVKSYIEDHFAYDIRAEQLAAIACMGLTKLRASFKQTYGSTITEYIQNRRIAHAEFLLVETDFPIGQVAQAVGYHHGGRFSALFKKNTGLTPEEYRKLMLQTERG